MIKKTKFKDLYIFENKSFKDNRGYFKELLKENKIKKKFLFSVMSYSKKNVIRGMHFQLKNKQTKIITVLSGKILDVSINLRKKSKDFGKVYYFLITGGQSVYIPNYFAHGYECISKNASILYHLDNYRDAKNEKGIPYNDKKIKIKWKTKRPILSLRDKNHMNFKEFQKKIKTL